MVGMLRRTFFIASITGLLLIGILAILRMEPSMAYLPLVRYSRANPTTGIYDHDLTVIDFHGNHVINTYSDPSFRSILSISPDKKWIYVLNNSNQLMRIHVISSTIEKINTPKDFHSLGAFSPDGNWLIFRGGTGNAFDLYRMRPDGSDVRQLTNRPGNDFCEMWTSDNKWIIYTNYDSRSPQNIEIYRMRPDGSQKLNLSNHPKADQVAGISADGQWLIFWSDRDGNGELYRVRLDGSGLQNLTNHPAADGFEFMSPDREWIYFSSERGGIQHLYRMKVDGSNLEQLTNLATTDYQVELSPDGHWIVFKSGDNLYKVRSDGTQLSLLVRNIGTIETREFSPDSEWFYFSGRGYNINSRYELNRVQLKDGYRVQVTNQGVLVDFLSFSGKVWQPAYPLIAWSATLLTACAWLIRRQRSA